MLAELARGVADAADHGAGFGFQHLHGEGDLAVLVTPAGVDQLLFGDPRAPAALPAAAATVAVSAHAQANTTEQGSADHARGRTQRGAQRHATARAERRTPQRRRRPLVTQLGVQPFGGGDLRRLRLVRTDWYSTTRPLRLIGVTNALTQ